MTDEDRYTSAQFYSFLAYHITNGLPAPKAISIRPDAISVDFNSIADRQAWQPAFGMQDAFVHEQPHPLDGPGPYQEWITHVSASWHGWHLSLGADDPITDENRRYWVESGRAAQRAEYVAELAKRGEQS